MTTDEGNSQNQIWHWTKDNIGVSVQSLLWLPVELIRASKLKFSGPGFKSPSGQLLIATLYIYIYIYIYII